MTLFDPAAFVSESFAFEGSYLQTDVWIVPHDHIRPCGYTGSVFEQFAHHRVTTPRISRINHTLIYLVSIEKSCLRSKKVFFHFFVASEVLRPQKTYQLLQIDCNVRLIHEAISVVKNVAGILGGHPLRES